MAIAAHDASLFTPGRNCWLVEEASRFQLLIDGEAYFSTLVEVLSMAQQTIFIVGWDLHSQTVLLPGRGDDGPRLGAFLNELVRRRPTLEIYILAWDPSAIYALEREWWPRARQMWGNHPRIHFQWASDHPFGASHHQKIVVVDDSVACVGGLDLTVSRWDTREHRVDDERRFLPDGSTYGPFHDVHAIVEGRSAQRIGELVRARWARSTSFPPPPLGDMRPCWPTRLRNEIRDVPIAIARTLGAWNGHPAIREVEQLHVDAIASARTLVYLENQFISSRRIAEALGASLQRHEGPEIVIVTSAHGLGPIESRPLLALRSRFIQGLRAVDAHGRLAIYAPRSSSTCAIKVHSKVTIIDDRILRVGSANITNRAMSLDSECDLALEATRPDVEAAIRHVREELLTEHLGCSLPAWQQVLAETGDRHIPAIDRLRGEERTLVPLEDDARELPIGLLDCVADAEAPLHHELLRVSIPDEKLRHRATVRLPRLAVSLFLVLGLLALWMTTPVSQWTSPDRLAELARGASAHPLGPFLALLAFCVASTLMVPVTVLIITSALLFEPWTAAIIALLGSLTATTMSYGIGRYFWSGAVARFVGTRLRNLTRRLSTTGIVSVALVRIIPVAPFAVINLVAGSARVPLLTLLLGTLFGMTPGILAITLATERVVMAARNPGPITITIAVFVLLLIAAGMTGLRRLLRRSESA